MKTIVMGLTGLLVFAAAMVGGWYAKTEILTKPVEEAAEDPPVDLTADPVEHVEESAAGKSDLMPVAVREDAMSVEELLRFSLSLKERDRVLRDQEDQFQQRQIQQQLVLSDIQKEQASIDQLRSEVNAKLAGAQTMVDELNRLREAVVVEREKTKSEFSTLESKQINIAEEYKANDKKLSTWLQGMTSEKAAAVLKEMANDGNIKVAVQILSNFEEREAAKILDSVDDPKMLNEFINEFRNLKTARTTQGKKPRGN